jgi:hypothetical protein
MTETTNPESPVQHMENFNLTDERKGLFRLLSHVLTVSDEKFSKEKAANGDRLSWGRLIVQCVAEYGRILATAQIDDLAQDVKLIKEKIGMNDT